MAAAAWSPDGRRIAAVKDGKRIVLIDAANLSRQRNLGSGTYPVWSPDSKRPLTRKWEFSCKFMLYGDDSVQVIDVDTGKSSLIQCTHCRLHGSYSWLDWQQGMGN